MSDSASLANANRSIEKLYSRVKLNITQRNNNAQTAGVTIMKCVKVQGGNKKL